jgi:hypothetical protein
MKNEIPPSTTRAPTPMATAAPPLRPPLELPGVVAVVMVGVVVVGVVPGVTGSPGDSGLPGL